MLCSYIRGFFGRDLELAVAHIINTLVPAINTRPFPLLRLARSSPRTTLLLIPRPILVAQLRHCIHSKAYRLIHLFIPTLSNGSQESCRSHHGKEARCRASPPLLQRYVAYPVLLSSSCALISWLEAIVDCSLTRLYRYDQGGHPHGTFSQQSRLLACWWSHATAMRPRQQLSPPHRAALCILLTANMIFHSIAERAQR